MDAEIACVLTDNFKDVEYTDPMKAFHDAGHEVKVISDESGAELKGKQGEATVTSDRGIDDVKQDDYGTWLIWSYFLIRQIADEDI